MIEDSVLCTNAQHAIEKQFKEKLKLTANCLEGKEWAKRDVKVNIKIF